MKLPPQVEPVCRYPSHRLICEPDQIDIDDAFEQDMPLPDEDEFRPVQVCPLCCKPPSVGVLKPS